jgi:outer membrane receptor protein involved in Fe transport
VLANIGYLNASFSNYTRADGTEVEKQEQAQAPRYTANFVSLFELSENTSWRLEFDVKDDYRFSDSHDVRSRGYMLVNTSFDWLIDQWQLQLWAKNLFDRDYTVRGFGGFSNDPRDGEFGYETPEPYFQFGTGRRIGLTARYTF